MAVVIRLARHGTHKRPFYRVVAADKQFSRDGRFLEVLGTYNPMVRKDAVKLNPERIQYWMSVGAKASPTVSKLVREYKEAAPASEAAAEAPAAEQPAEEKAESAEA